jgi:hypothetical protein
MDCNHIRAAVTLIFLLIVAAVSASGSQDRTASGRHEIRQAAAGRRAPADDGRRFF